MPEYKLYYFPLRARAEAIRLLLHYKSIPFEDVRIPREEWPSKKSSFTFGQVPVLEVDGKQIAHSWSILRYLANKHGLAGKDDDERVKLDQILELHRDLADQIGPYVRVLAGFSQGDKETLRLEKLLPSMDKLAPYYDKFLKESGTGFFGKSGPSYVDFYIADAFYTLHGVEKDLLDKKYPYLVEHYKRVYALPELQNYLSTRPQTSV